MKKLLAILGAIGMTATAGVTVVACGNNNKQKPSDQETITAKLTDKIHVNDETNLTVDEKFDIDKIEISYDKDIIEVNKDSEKHLFVIKGLKVGESKITLKLEGFKDWIATLKVLKEDQEILDIKAELEGKLEKVGDKATIIISNYDALDFVEIGNTNPEVISTSEIVDSKVELEVLTTGKATITLTAENAQKKEFEFNIEAEEPEPDPDTTVKVDNLDKNANWIKIGDDGEIHAKIADYEKLKNVEVTTSDESLEVLNDNGKLHIAGFKTGQYELKVSATEMKEFKTTIFVVDELVQFDSVALDTNLFCNDDSIEAIYEVIKAQNPEIIADTEFFSEKGNNENEYVVWTNNYVGKLHFVYNVRTKINDIKINDVEIKDVMSEVKAKINQVITKTVGFDVKENEDYIVEGNTDKANQNIVVTAMESSFKLQGQFEILVNKFDISHLSLNVSPSEIEDITNNIAPRVADLIRNAITEPINEIDLGTDFSIETNLAPEVTPFGENVTRLTVTTNPNSNYIRGSFDLDIKHDLADINFAMNGVIGLNEREAITKIDQTIQKFASGSTIEDWAITKSEIHDNFEIWTISADKNSEYLVGSFDLVRRINISKLILDGTNLTPNEAKDKINNMVEDLANSYSVKATANEDWKIVENKDENGQIVSLTVKAGEDSDIFVGSFEVTINMVNISSIDLGNDLIGIEDESEAFVKVGEVIQKIAPQATMNDWTASKPVIEGDYQVITISAKENSTTIFGSFKVNRRILEQKWDVTPYESGKKIWVYIDAFKDAIDEETDTITGDILLTDKQWSEILWTGMLNALPNSEALKEFNEKNIDSILHFTGNPNEVFSKLLKGHVFGKDFLDGIKLDGEEIEKLGIKLDEDLVSYTNTQNPQRYLLKKSEVTFKDLTFFIGLPSSTN